MLQILLPKELFEDIILTKTNIVERKVSSYWKKELLDISIVNDKIEYKIKTIDKIRIANEYGEDKPNIVVECLKLDYNVKKNIFEFYLGRVIEKRNVEVQDSDKDILIKELLKQKQELEDSLNKDDISKLYNRRKLNEDLHRYISQNNAKNLSAVFIKIDEFENIEQQLQNRVIKQVAARVKTHANRLYADAYSYTNYEFMMLCFLPQGQLIFGLDYLIKEINTLEFLNNFLKTDNKVAVGVSFFKNHKNLEEFIQQAITSAKKAKEEGSSRVVFE